MNKTAIPVKLNLMVFISDLIFLLFGFLNINYLLLLKIRSSLALAFNNESTEL
jgi:hypothetical protein